MTINNFKLSVLCAFLIIVQFLINNLTIIYVDLLTIVPIILLLSGRYNWLQLIILSIIADLIGHWYLGSHLLAITILSLFSNGFANFYKICNAFQRTVLAGLFFLFSGLIVYIVSIATERAYLSGWGFVTALFVALPIVQYLMNRWILASSSDFLFYD
jgi:hypothetical protein